MTPPDARAAASRRPELRRAVVVGGGIAGLTGAWELQKAGIPTVLLEAREEVGGIVGRALLAGLPVDSGAESFAVRGGHVGALIEELGLGESIEVPRPGSAWLQLPEAAAPLPALSLHGIPSVPLASDVIAVLGWRGALRAQLDRLLPVGNAREESLASLVRRRMGQRVVDRLLRPVFGGVRSVPPEQVAAAAAVPGLHAAMTRSGSLSGAVALLREQSSPGSQVAGLDGGMQTLIAALREQFLGLGGTLRTGIRVSGVDRLGGAAAAGLATGAGWRIRTADDRSSSEGGGPRGGVADIGDADPTATSAVDLRADLLLVAVDPVGLGELLPSLAPLAEPVEAWSPPTTEPVVLVTLLIDASALDAHPRGSGVLVAEPGDGPKALTHSSAKWSWWASRLPDSRHLVRLSYRELTETGDALERRALADASRLLGTPLALGDLVSAHRQEWRMPVLVARPGVEPLTPLPDLALTGSAVSGTGLAATIPHARAAARRLLAHRG